MWQFEWRVTSLSEVSFKINVMPWRKNFSENHTENHKISSQNRQKSRQKPTKTDKIVGFEKLFCRFLSVRKNRQNVDKNRQKPTKVRCRFTSQVWLTIPFERLPELCPGTHISPEFCQLAQRAIKHTQWYSSTIQCVPPQESHAPLLTRVFRDMRQRFSGFSTLNVCVSDLLVAHCIMNNPKQEETGRLTPQKVMRRLLQLLASGIFLPHSVGLTDPTEQGYRIQQNWSLNDMDIVCTTAQTLLRVWCNGWHRAVLGLDNTSNLDSQISIWNDIVVTPSECVLKQE